MFSSTSTARTLFSRLTVPSRSPLTSSSVLQSPTKSALHRGAPSRTMATVVDRLNDLAANLPHKDAVMYHKQNNMKWTFGELKKYSDALSSGLLELGLRPKDTILTWLPSHTAEQHVLQLACARAGFVLACLDEGVRDVEVVGRVLRESGSVAVFVMGDTRIPFEVHDENGNPVDDDAGMDLLEYDNVYTSTINSLMPNLTSFQYHGKKVDSKGDWTSDPSSPQIASNFVDHGLSFSTPNFPSFKFPIQTGFDKIDGFYNYKHLMAFNGDSLLMYKGCLVGGKPIKEDGVKLPEDGVLVRGKTNVSFVKGEMVTEEVEPDYLHIPKSTDTVSIEYDSTGKKGAELNHDQVLKTDSWKHMNAILNKEYIEPQNSAA
ncbi:hypothetical protein TrLO_g3879 [Triparma laevis f. longispina]|uniref:AMP-dependent synthetase/ligase domain-containing protein n=1 Tax=Triparma laevis f. longispina TaxID=1714387 RepID=A0A9W7AIW4_9STRA|nr:hypothetical protein TrLO_g3879 [Triparma laevis f. longispina]